MPDSDGQPARDAASPSRFNSLRHGLTARSIILPGESEEEWERLRDDLLLACATCTICRLATPIAPGSVSIAKRHPHRSRRLRQQSKMQNAFFCEAEELCKTDGAGKTTNSAKRAPESTGVPRSATLRAESPNETALTGQRSLIA